MWEANVHIRTARAILQRLALCAGLCAGAWLAAEGLDHGTARADDVPIRIEQEQPSERPGGPLDELLDGVLPGRGSDNEDPPGEDNDNGRGNDDPPAEQPRDDDEPDTPVRDVVDEILDEVLPEPPGPVDGDDGSPQHPVDTPPAPDPTPETPATPVVDTPTAGEPVLSDPPEATSVQGSQPPPAGWTGPAPWTSHLATDVQTESRTGGSVCDSQVDHDGTGRGGRPGTSTRDRLTSPRGLAGPGLVPPSAPCQPAGPDAGPGTAAPTLKPPGDPVALSTAASGYALTVELHGAGRTRGDDTAPAGRLTLWPPGPG